MSSLYRFAMFSNNKIIYPLVGFLLLGGILLAPESAQADHAHCSDIHAAAFMDEPGELSLLLRHGVDLNCRDNLHQTPLITATDGASLGIVKMLLAMNVAVNARDQVGETALAKARQKLAFFDMEGGEGYRNLYLEMITLLERAGAVE
jgi:hypothetical protein